MALSNIFGWNKKEAQPGAACGTACGAADKPDEKPAACGTACGAADKPAACGTACGSQGPVDLGSEPTEVERRASDK